MSADREAAIREITPEAWDWMKAKLAAAREEFLVEYTAARERERAQDKALKTLREALIAMVYVHPCNCGDGIPQGACARCRAVKVLGFDPAATEEQA